MSVTEIRIALSVLAVVVAGGCQATSERTDYAERFDTVRDDVSYKHFKLQMHEFTELFASTIEATADLIAEQTDDPRVRRNALLWKVNGFPAVHVAGYRLEPVAAAADCWLLTVQMRNFFTDGAGRDAFGEQQGLAIAAMDRLDVEIRSIAESVADFPSTLESWTSRMEARATDQPLPSFLFTRDADLRDLPDFSLETTNVFQAVGTMEELSIDLAARATSYAAQLPKLARWQAELLLMDLAEHEIIRQLLRDVETAAAAAERAAEIPDRIERLSGALEAQRLAIVESLREERVMILEAVTAEREAILEGIGEQSGALLEAVTAERGLLLEGVDLQRTATLESLQAERALVLAAIHDEREAAVQEADAIVQKALESIEPTLASVVDHAVWRAVQLLIACVVVFPFLTWLYRRLVPRAA